MLKGLDPLLSPALLLALAEMGHGDTLVLVDRNFPAAALAQRLVRLDGATLAQAARAILTLLPLDTFTAVPVAVMQVGGAPGEVPAVQQDILDLAAAVEQRTLGVEHLERFDFYTRASAAYVIVATGEARPYGCLMFVKGVL
jgi:L-fucose mutarotase